MKNIDQKTIALISYELLVNPLSLSVLKVKPLLKFEIQNSKKSSNTEFIFLYCNFKIELIPKNTIGIVKKVKF